MPEWYWQVWFDGARLGHAKGKQIQCVMFGNASFE